MRFQVRAVALSAAIVSGSLSFVLNVLSVFTGFARELFSLIAPFHPGYTHTLSGALVSAFWMFVYGYIVGAVFALIYNSLTKR